MQKKMVNKIMLTQTYKDILVQLHAYPSRCYSHEFFLTVINTVAIFTKRKLGMNMLTNIYKILLLVCCQNHLKLFPVYFFVLCFYSFNLNIN